MKKKLITAVVTFALALSSLTGCGGAATSGNTSTQTTGDSSVITIARPIDSSTLDPIMTGNNEDIWLLSLMLQGLTKSSADGTEIEPCLAETWDISDDNLTYTFHIRKDLKFSTGDPVTKDDWEYSLNRYLTSEESPWRGMVSMVDSIEVPDDTTVIFHLNAVSPTFLASTALFCMSVMPKAYCEEVGEDGIASKPVGTGPYALESWTIGDSMTFVKNQYYWDAGKPETDKIVFNVVADDNTRVMQLQSGQVDAITYVPNNRVDELKATDGIEVLSFDSTESRHITLNNSVEALSDARVRMALLKATDREALISAVYYGNAELSTGLIGPAQPYYDKDLAPVAYDLEDAKELLKEAGYENGFEVTIDIRSGNSNELQEATMLKEQWAKAGVTLNIEELDGSTVSDEWYSMDFEMMFTSLTSDTADTNQFAQGISIADLKDCYHTLWSGEKQKEAEKLATEAGTEMDTAKRAEEYNQLQEICAEENPILPLYYIPFMVATRSNVKNFSQTPLGSYNFDTLVKE